METCNPIHLEALKHFAVRFYWWSFSSACRLQEIQLKLVFANASSSANHTESFITQQMEWTVMGNANCGNHSDRRSRLECSFNSIVSSRIWSHSIMLSCNVIGIILYDVIWDLATSCDIPLIMSCKFIGDVDTLLIFVAVVSRCSSATFWGDWQALRMCSVRRTITQRMCQLLPTHKPHSQKVTWGWCWALASNILTFVVSQRLLCSRASLICQIRCAFKQCRIVAWYFAVLFDWFF